MPAAILADPLPALRAALNGRPVDAGAGLHELLQDVLRLREDGSAGRRVELDELLASCGRRSRLAALAFGRGPADPGGGTALGRVLEPAWGGPDADPLDHFLLGTTALSALRARRLFFTRELRYRLRPADRGGVCRMMAVGAGPDPEILQVLADAGADAPAVRVTLLDVDRDSLDAVRARAAVLGCERGVAVGRLDPAALRLPRAAGEQDLIYVPYLLDHVPDDAAERLLERAYERLRPGGHLLVAHYQQDLTPVDRLVLESWLGWRPCYRSPRRLARILSRTSAGRFGRAVGLVRGPNVYIVVERTRPVDDA